MKKTLVALTVAALTATSASALTVYQQDNNSIEVGGAIKLALSKETGKKTEMLKKDAKINVKAKYGIGSDAYALGFYEYDFLTPKVKKAYVGLGNSAHQVTFGMQNTIGDDVGEAGFDNLYGVGKSYVDGSGDDLISYRYTGLENWTFGLDYNVKVGNEDSKKNAAVLGAIYSADNFTAEFAYQRKDKRNSVDTAFSVQADNVKYALDFGFSKDKDSKVVGDNSKTDYYVAPGVKVQLDKTGLYGTYAYEKKAGKKSHGVNLGVDYAIAKNSLLFVEGNYTKEKGADKANKAIGVGMKVEW
ncbi:porin [Phocoenobacter atlanticus]|uniref:porin n=1 Tax=Phocoenobacter atlanticus TaxID=3416742 RepID=UPI0027439424|nr:porin [Pasteurella atlantica]MDP8101847.1 porin [Pasteurella atlantica]